MNPAAVSGATLIRRIASGGVWAVGGRAGLAITGLAINALVVRLLQPEDVGFYFLVISGLAMAAVVSTLGLQQAVVRMAAEALGAGKPGEAAGVIRVALVTGCGLASIVGVLVTFSGDILIGVSARHAVLPGVMLLIGIWVVAKAAESLIAESFRGLHDIRLATLHNMLLGNLFLLAMLGFLWWSGQKSLQIVFATSVSATLIAAVIGYGLLQCRLATMGPPVAPAPSNIAQVAAPMLATGMMLIIISQADLWIVGWFLPPHQVAIYGASIRLVQVVMVPMLIVNAVLPPFIASLYREGRLAELEQVIRVAAAAGCVPMACVLMVFAFAAAPILELIYGPFYRDGAAALILVSTGQFINGLAGASAVVLMMTGHQFAMMCISVFCGLLLVIGGLAMVETQGMTGVAAATGLSVALHGVLSLLWVKHKTGMWTFCGGLGSIRHVRATLSTGT